MTTYTRIPEDEAPSIHIDVERRLSKIDDNIYGGFLEHMGRCIYGGIYDPKSPRSDSNGFRTDVLSALRELSIPVMRYPGGNFVATYHWTDGIGPRDKRPKRPELAWLGTETNQFGTDEFMHWLSALGGGCEPYIALNFGTGTLDEALAWVEYCNGTGDTYWANKRRENGREEPYNVKYWALGNEMWGPWQVGQMTAAAYADRAAQWAKALKLLDPNLILILCGETGHSEWDHQVLQHCIPYIDMHSIHIYTAATSSDTSRTHHLANAIAPLSAERAIQIAAGLIDLARITKKIPPSVKKTTICFDEWNVWSPTRAPGELGAEEEYTLSDALAVAIWLNVFIRQSAYVGMANIAQTVNVISPLMTNKNGIVKQTTWWPLWLFCKFMRGWTLGCHVRCGAWDVNIGGKGKPAETTPEWLAGVLEGEASWLDVSASINSEGVISAVAVNISETKDFEVIVKGVKDSMKAGEKVKVYPVTGPSVEAINTEKKQEVGIQESTWNGEGKYKFGKHSITMLRWETGIPVRPVGAAGIGIVGEKMDTRGLAWQETKTEAPDN